MVDPVNFTNYGRTDAELEEAILFGVCAAGKNAINAARALDRFLARAHQIKKIRFAPFRCLKRFTKDQTVSMLHSSGVGCQNAKGRSIHELVNSGLNLRTCSEDDLDRIYGIGLKTASLFTLHTRPGRRVACLDVHILRHLKKLGYKVPPVSPSSRKQYKEIEGIVLELADATGVTPAAFDLALWREYSGHTA